MSTLYRIACHVDMKCTTAWYEQKRPGTEKNRDDSLQRSAPLRYRNCPEIRVLHVNKRPIRYGFRAGPRAIWQSVDIALGE